MSFVDQQNLYLVQELCAFGSLSSLRIHLRHDQQISRKEAIWHYSGQILSAIEFMHSHSIVHCDLKPENVMISNHCINSTCNDFQVKIIDFGCAIDLAASGHVSGVDFAGTADYVSPEVIKGSREDGADADDHDSNGNENENENENGTTEMNELRERVYPMPNFVPDDAPAIDLWAFGCLVYFMIAGNSPFHDDSDQLTLRRIINYVQRNEKFKPEQRGEGQFYPDTSTLNMNGNNSCGADDDESIFADEHINALDLVHNLLVPDPASRLGMCDKVASCRSKRYESIRSHAFYLESGNLDEYNANIVGAIALCQQVQTDIHENDMQDGAHLPFDFFS